MNVFENACWSSYPPEMIIEASNRRQYETALQAERSSISCGAPPVPHPWTSLSQAEDRSVIDLKNARSGRPQQGQFMLR
jgi:hypothetical protein